MKFKKIHITTVTIMQDLFFSKCIIFYSASIYRVLILYCLVRILFFRSSVQMAKLDRTLIEIHRCSQNLGTALELFWKYSENGINRKLFCIEFDESRAISNILNETNRDWYTICLHSLY